MVDARGEARLLQEHLDELGLARQVRVQALDGDEALEAADAREPREEHRGHPAGRELGHELEPIELPARLPSTATSLLSGCPPVDRVMPPIMTPQRARTSLSARPPRDRTPARPGAPVRGRSTCDHWVKKRPTTAVTAATPPVAASRMFVRRCASRPCWYWGQLVPARRSPAAPRPCPGSSRCRAPTRRSRPRRPP